MNVDHLTWLQQFYAGLCNGDWEHSYGFSISNIDNPGWRIEFDICGTYLEREVFIQRKTERTELDWIHCVVKEKKFIGYGGPGNLSELISVFREWVDEHTNSGAR